MKNLWRLCAVVLTVKLLLWATASNSGIYEEDPDLYCLAQNVYHEARGDNLAGKIAVSLVVLNRVESAKFPDTICEVIYQGPTDNRGVPLRDKCQFSWWCDGRSDEPTNARAWSDALDVAMYVLEGADDFTEGATHYHAFYVKPYWSDSLHFIGPIGQHIFYRWD